LSEAGSKFALLYNVLDNLDIAIRDILTADSRRFPLAQIAAFEIGSEKYLGTRRRDPGNNHCRKNRQRSDWQVEEHGYSPKNEADARAIGTTAQNGAA
jgi:hypothetical protein